MQPGFSRGVFSDDGMVIPTPPPPETLLRRRVLVRVYACRERRRVITRHGGGLVAGIEVKGFGVEIAIRSEVSKDLQYFASRS